MSFHGDRGATSYENEGRSSQERSGKSDVVAPLPSSGAIGIRWGRMGLSNQTARASAWSALGLALVVFLSAGIGPLSTPYARADESAPALKRAQELGEAGKSAEAIALLDALLKDEPAEAFAYYLRAREKLRSGAFVAAVADFDAFLERQPQAAPRQWERGIALYYAGNPAEGAKQFELYQTYDHSDVENVVWRFVCQAKAEGVEQARASLLPVGNDPRVPMKEVYALFAGTLQPADVTAAVEASNAPADVNRVQRFYAHLYLGLYFEATGDAGQAKTHILAAAEIPPAGHYMGDIAKVHADVLRKELPAAGSSDALKEGQNADSDDEASGNGAQGASTSQERATENGQGRSAANAWNVRLRRQTRHGSGWRVQTRDASWDPRQTAIIVCDMWDYHHSLRATERVAEVARRMDRALQRARGAGATILHAPSACMDAYRDHPARRRAQAAAPAANLPSGIKEWLPWLSEAEQADFPLDDKDGGVDDDPEIGRRWHEKLAAMGRTPGSPWKRQIASLAIDPQRDLVSDQGGEIWNALEQQKIRNVLLMGVHANMCVLGRPFGLRQMAKNGRNVALVRDLTDVMYNPSRAPRVDHFTGIDLIVQHVERHVCPTISSEQLLGDDDPFRFAEDRRKRLAMLIADDEYDTYATLPAFAVERLGRDFQVSYVHDDPASVHDLHDLESLKHADLVLISMRRRALKSAQLEAIKDFVQAGKPVVGIRTASHAFVVEGETPDEGRAQWPEFDAEVLGGAYHGHHGNKEQGDPRTFVQVARGAAAHPIVRGLPESEFLTPGWLYKTSPIGERTELLMTGRVEGREPQEPVAWTNVNRFGGRVFYTSLGHPGDFALPEFQRLLQAGVYWAAGLETPIVEAKDSRLPSSPLEMTGDIASQLVSAADLFLLRQLEEGAAARMAQWRQSAASDASWASAIAERRRRLTEILGLTDSRVKLTALELMATTERSALVARGPNYDVHRVRWPVLDGVHGEGLLLTPMGDARPLAHVIALPHCDVAPEAICGLTDELDASAQYARRLAESGCRVIVPMLINRREKVGGITNREWLHRAAYEMGRTLTGYEVQKTLALVDWLDQTARGEASIGVAGWGDGALLAAYAAAVDERIDGVLVSGAWGDMENVWRQPADRMAFSLLNHVGDAELAAMAAPRTLVVETGTEPIAKSAPGGRGAPYEIVVPPAEEATGAVDRARQLAARVAPHGWLSLIDSRTPGSDRALSALLAGLAPGAPLAPLGSAPRAEADFVASEEDAERHARQMDEIERHTQGLLRVSHWVRKEKFWDKLDTSSVEAYEASIAPLRKKFYDETIGRFDRPLDAPEPRARLVAESPKWKRYEVVLDVYDELFAYGILTVPTDIADGDRRPAIVCQHGLEGRPQDVVGEASHAYYKAFATQLAERGFVTFAPQNLYIFTDRFRTLQRKANAIGKTLFSLITPQHQQIVDWLQTLDFVDPQRIGFYGLSYGGKTAMRVPPLVEDYALAICSADFNEWVDKNASTSNPRSYVHTSEYEIFEWNLGHTFNYAEMAALIAPRPFMVERGHFDGVADDWTVAWEYARVRLLYAGMLKIPDRTEIEWFDGLHSIHGAGTYEFLHRHLAWPVRAQHARK